MNESKTSKLSLSDKIHELLAPVESRDPELNSDDETIAKTRFYESEDEQEQPVAELSHIRKKNVRMLQDVDAKYRGKISSRSEFEQNESSEYEDSSESEADVENFSRLKELDSGEDDVDDNIQDSDIEGVDDEQGKKEGQLDIDDNEEDLSDEVDDNEEDSSDEVDDNEEDSSDEVDDNEEASSNADDDNEEVSTNADEDNEEASSNDDDDSESDFDGGDIMPDKIKSSDQDAEPSESTERQLQTSKDVAKGTCIQNQLIIWEKLLEIRIHSQKLLLKANSLPPVDQFQQYMSNQEIDEAVNKTSENVENLLSKMFSLQKTLVNQFPEMKAISEKRKRTDYSDETDKISKFSKKLESEFVDYKDYRNATISKWHDRTKILAPGNKASKQPAFDILRNIEGVLSNKAELVKKSQLYKGGYQIIGVDTERLNDSSDGKAQEESESIHYSDIYDDTDFYHTQLRELIEFKANASNNPAEMTRQFIELQKLRNKIKKVVDTRASKGRRIRYAVHNKMMNFMARNDPSEWTSEAKTELFSSLFGSEMS